MNMEMVFSSAVRLPLAVGIACLMVWFLAQILSVGSIIWNKELFNQWKDLNYSPRLRLLGWDEEKQVWVTEFC